MSAIFDSISLYIRLYEALFEGSVDPCCFYIDVISKSWEESSVRGWKTLLLKDKSHSSSIWLKSQYAKDQSRSIISHFVLFLFFSQKKVKLLSFQWVVFSVEMHV